MNRSVLVLACFLVFAAGAFGAERRPDDPREVVQTYGDVPKGVVLEGTAEGFEPLTSVTYDKDKNEFTINEKFTYKNPIARKEFAQLFKALIEDDLIGVTLLEGKTKTYGKLSVTSPLVNYMAETDKLLGGIVYGIDFLLENTKLPGNYKPKKTVDRKIPVVAFSSLSRFMFDKRGTEYVRSGCSLEVTLIPLADQKAQGGGHLPDVEKTKIYVMEENDRANLDHLRTHQLDYFKMSEFSKTVATGEAAAFARLIRESKIDNEVLLKSIK